MDVVLEARIDASPAAVLAEVADLATYPRWHGMVLSVEPDGDGWYVELGGRYGPFTQTKRVRLVRAGGRQPGCVTFERAELDGRQHSPWELEGTVTPVEGPGPCTLRFRLFYGGSSPLIGMLEPILRAEVHKSAERLRQRLAAA